jgi:ABC-type glycerol-3-phosphate transport system permease component
MDSKNIIIIIVMLIITPLWWAFVKKSKNKNQVNAGLKDNLKDGFVLGRYVVLILSGLLLLYFIFNMDFT